MEAARICDEELERLLSPGGRISDLIAFLAALDPEPFLAALGFRYGGHGSGRNYGSRISRQ